MKSTSLTNSLLFLIAAQALGQSTVLPVPDGVKALRDVAYVEGGHDRQKLDLYVPEKAGEARPLIIWIHGGGWQGGSKEGCPPMRGGYLERGYAVASLNYRLSGDAVFPAQIEDCKAAIRWLRAHAKEYSLDPQRFGVWGSSAGGHLVALVGTSGGVKEFDAGANLDQSSRVQAVCDFYGPTDFSVFVTTPGYERHATADSPEAKLIGGAVLENEEKAGRVNPIAYVGKDDPPFLIVHGDKDATVPLNQSQLLFEALKKAGVSAHFHTIHGAGHGGPGFNGRNIDEMVAAFFEERLKKGSAKVDALVTESTAAAAEGRPPAPGAEPRLPAARPKPGASVLPVIRNFQLAGERWTCEADGQRMAGILLKPGGGGPHPAMLVNHGMGSNAEQFGMMKGREFVKWGFVCIATDLTHARAEGNADRSQFGASAENLRRARACLAILRSLPEVDGKRICAYGNSMGAFLTIGLAADVPEQLAAAAITAGGVITQSGFASPTVEAAGKIRTPFLVLHGSADQAVPTENSARLKEVLDEHRVRNERRVFEGVGHGLHAEKAEEVFRLMREWFRGCGVLGDSTRG